MFKRKSVLNYSPNLMNIFINLLLDLHSEDPAPDLFEITKKVEMVSHVALALYPR